VGSRTVALQEFGLEEDRRTLLVFGGSQGAEALNQAVWSALPGVLARADLQVVHLVGRRNYGLNARRQAEKKTSSGPLIYRAFDYMEHMELAYAVADLALSRAGAGTIAELMATGLPAVLVPFPHATGGHQEKNAKALARTGAVAVVLQREESAAEAVDMALQSIGDTVILERMREAAASATRPGGAEGIARLIEEVT
jgi:UDP-N-acetylglucosamine--N-acetylmuramyl-(pentapeptide) pyrophosphoryl-undecaprenol N-acetylglucosamine transferase